MARAAVVRPGLYRDTIAGMVWMLLRLRGCMRYGELAARLRMLGVDVGDYALRNALARYRGILFQNKATTINGVRRVVWCALEKV